MTTLAPARPRRPDPAPTIAALRALLGDRLSTAAAVREHHGKDATYHAGHAPDAVAFPALDRGGRRHRPPLRRPRHAGHRLRHRHLARGPHRRASRAASPSTSSRLDRILEVNAADLDARVEAGVTRKALNAHLRDTGLFFPIDPGADASIGGMAATRACGTNAVRYGTMRDNVLGLTVVTADGTDRPHRQPRPQVLRRLRPHPALRRLRGHPRHHHRGPAPPLRHPRGDRRPRSAPSPTSPAPSTR